MSKIVPLGQRRVARDAAAFESHAEASFLGFVGTQAQKDESLVRPLSKTLLDRIDCLCSEIEANQQEQHLLEG